MSISKCVKSQLLFFFMFCYSLHTNTRERIYILYGYEWYTIVLVQCTAYKMILFNITHITYYIIFVGFVCVCVCCRGLS